VDGSGGRVGEKKVREFFGREKPMEKVLSWEMADGGRDGKSDGDGERRWRGKQKEGESEAAEME